MPDFSSVTHFSICNPCIISVVWDAVSSFPRPKSVEVNGFVGEEFALLKFEGDSGFLQ